MTNRRAMTDKHLDRIFSRHLPEPLHGCLQVTCHTLTSLNQGFSTLKRQTEPAVGFPVFGQGITSWIFSNDSFYLLNGQVGCTAYATFRQLGKCTDCMGSFQVICNDTRCLPRPQQ